MGDEADGNWRLPNPYEVQGPGHEDFGKRDQRRQRILAAARCLIVELRFTGFTVRRLAVNLGLTTQALHGRFGSRDAIIAAAINDYSLALLRHGSAARLDPHPIRAFVLAYCAACETYPEFFRRILPNTYFERSGARVFQMTHSQGTIMIHRALAEMRRQSRLAGHADLRLVAMTVSTIMGATLLDWASSAMSAAELRRQMVYKVDLLLDGIEVQRSARAD